MSDVRYLAEAEAELLKDAQFYAAREPYLGQRFLQSVSRTVALIAKKPQLGKPLTVRLRSMVVRRFP